MSTIIKSIESRCFEVRGFETPPRCSPPWCVENIAVPVLKQDWLPDAVPCLRSSAIELVSITLSSFAFHPPVPRILVMTSTLEAVLQGSED